MQPATEIATQKWENILAKHDSESSLNENAMLKRKVVEALTDSLKMPNKQNSTFHKSNSLIQTNTNSSATIIQPKLNTQSVMREPNKTVFVPNQTNKIYPTISNAMSNIEALIQISASDGIRRSSPLINNSSNNKMSLPFNLTKKHDGLAYIKQESYPKFPYVPSSPFQSYDNKNNSSETSSKSELLKKNSFDDEYLEDDKNEYK